MWIDQFGEVIAMAGHEEAIIVEEVDYSLIELRRYISSHKVKFFIIAKSCSQ